MHKCLHIFTEMDFYQSLGNLILGTRLRRLSEYYLTEINKTYQQQGIEFDSSWFPIFFLLSEQESLSIGDISKQLAVSHSATSQLITNLRKKGLLQTTVKKTDKRVQVVQLTAEGAAMLEKIKPIWALIRKTMNSIENDHPDMRHFLNTLQAMENAFQEKGLSERIQASTHSSTIDI